MSEVKQVALVTGASRGIGAAIADRLAQEYRVVGTATSERGAAAIAERLRKTGGDGKLLNVTDSDQIQSLIKEVTAEFGSPTVLVNNAGITRDQLLLRMSDDDWDAIMDTNLKGVFRVSKACLRGMMKARGGRIINITSVIGSIGNPGQANYAAAKAGIVGFTKSLAREVGSRNITANCVAPGFIDTDMTRALDEGARDSLLAGVPLGRLGDANDIAQAVAFLASPAASYITGETIHVNGGMFMS